MPTYDFQCPQGHTREEQLPIAERDDTLICFECDGLMVRRAAGPGFAIKGYSARNGYSDCPSGVCGLKR